MSPSSTQPRIPPIRIAKDKHTKQPKIVKTISTKKHNFNITNYPQPPLPPLPSDITKIVPQEINICISNEDKIYKKLLNKTYKATTTITPKHPALAKLIQKLILCRDPHTLTLIKQLLDKANNNKLIKLENQTFGSLCTKLKQYNILETKLTPINPEQYVQYKPQE